MKIQEIDDLVNWIKTNVLDVNQRNKHTECILPKEREPAADVLYSEIVDLNLVQSTELAMTEEKEELSLIEFIIGVDDAGV